ncbi:MAG: 3-dehydroquinate synthase [Phycisphaerales bacterium]|nr:3-dehydroquinate synthase [Phycisphaerales bacterium]
MIAIPVDIPGQASVVVVARGALENLAAILTTHGGSALPRRVLLCFDRNCTVHANQAARVLRAGGVTVTEFGLTATEDAKSASAVEAMWDAALAARLDRGDCFVALGGGLVGDLVGFAAATYLRGVRVVQIPTTLLAMVDAAIGGKTGINRTLPEGGLGKNLVGAFWQPSITIVDANTLRTLGKRELRAGLAECVKHGLIADLALFEDIRRDAEVLANNDESAIDRLLPRAISVKTAIVARDPLERGERAKLNLGHTFGHAIETIPTSTGRLLHGEAVAIGIVAAAAAAKSMQMLSADEEARIANTLENCGLPRMFTGATTANEVIRRMGFDKKNEGGKLRLILPRGLGACEIVENPPDSAVLAGLASIGIR